jgi:hypothetical protein
LPYTLQIKVKTTIKTAGNLPFSSTCAILLKTLFIITKKRKLNNLMGKILLTGVTGLVGSAFVVALLREKPTERFVCLVRSNGGGTAEERAAKVLREQCEFDGCPEFADKVLEAVEVIDGDVVDIVPEELAKLDMLKDSLMQIGGDVGQ